MIALDHHLMRATPSELHQVYCTMYGIERDVWRDIGRDAAQRGIGRSLNDNDPPKRAAEAQSP